MKRTATGGSREQGDAERSEASPGFRAESAACAPSAYGSSRPTSMLLPTVEAVKESVEPGEGRRSPNTHR